MAQKIPPEYLMGVLHSIEQVIVNIHKEYPRLADKDVEWVIEKLANYYKVRSRGKEIEEPTSPSERKQDLMDEILNAIDAREEIGADLGSINNPDIRQGEHIFVSLEQLYIMALKRLQSSYVFGIKKLGGQVT